MKDPAVLLFYDTWLTATAEMDADIRAWYLELLIHQHDKGSLPNCVEKLASLCRVKFSEFERFKQVFEDVFKLKFKLNSEDNRLRNGFMEEVLRKRERFTEKRTMYGKLSYFLKYVKEKKKNKDKDFVKFIKENVEQIADLDTKNEQELEQMFEQMLKQKSELFINGNGNGNKYIDKTKLYSKCLEYWLKEFHKGWTFSEIQGSHLKQIINKLIKIQGDAGKELTETAIIDLFKSMCQRLPDWYKDKDLQIINSKFNEIIEQIKNATGNKYKAANASVVDGLIAEIAK